MIGQEIAENDDIQTQTRNARCSRIDVPLFRAGQYLIEVGSFGEEPLQSYELNVQLTREISTGERVQGRLKQGESDVYSLTLFDHEALDRVIELIHRSETIDLNVDVINVCLLYTSPSPRDKRQSRMPSSA